MSTFGNVNKEKRSLQYWKKTTFTTRSTLHNPSYYQPLSIIHFFNVLSEYTVKITLNEIAILAAITTKL